MAKRQTAIDKAIATIDSEIAVLQSARARLVAQQPAAQPAAPRPPFTDMDLGGSSGKVGG